jgi:hypothetical protein
MTGKGDESTVEYGEEEEPSKESSSKSKKMDESVIGDISFYFSKVPLLNKELKNVVKNVPSDEA